MRVRTTSIGFATAWLAAPADEKVDFNFQIRPLLSDRCATLLRLLGVDHERLTYLSQGRRFRLTDVHGRVVNELLA